MSRYYQVDDWVEEEAPKLFGKSAKDVENDVVMIKNWLRNQPYLPEIMNDKMIKNFLIFNKFKTEKAIEKIVNYYSIRNKYPELFEGTHPKLPHMRNNIQFGYWVALPKLTNEMHRVTVCKTRGPQNRQSEAVPLYSSVHVFHQLEVRLHEDYMLNNIIILDMSNTPLSLLLRYTPNLTYKSFKVYEKVYSMRVCAFYIISNSSFIPMLLSILKRIMQPKVFDRVKVLEDEKDLMKYIPKRILPVDYGGEEKSIEELHQLCQKKLAEYEWRFDQLEGMKVDEHSFKQSKKHKNHENCVLS